MAPPPLSLGPPPPHTARRSRVLLSALAGVALVVLMLASGVGKQQQEQQETPAPSVAAADGPSASASPRVPVTIYVMSLCPDAQFCETFLQPILAPLKSIVKLRAEYIVNGPPTAAKEEGSAAAAAAPLTCKHGARECAGNRQQLCLQARLDERIAAGAASADATVDVLLKFLTCGWRDPGGIGTDEGARGCLAEAGWAAKAEQEGVLACAGGAEGEALLAASHAATTAAGATNSCTIDVAGKRRCVRDGGAFRECDQGSAPADFARTICGALPAEARKAAAAAGVCK